MNAPLNSLANELVATAAQSADILARCTLYPWIVTVHYVRHEWRRDGGRAPIFEQRIAVVQGTLADMPDAAAFMPDGAEFHKADVFPAPRFDDMKPEQRQRYRAQYRAFLMWRKAHAFGKTVEQLQPWTDYDPVLIDESVERWAKPFGRYCGD